MSKKKTLFGQSLFLNMCTWQDYYQRLSELAITSFSYEGLPDTVDPRYMELELYENGQIALFYDEGVDSYLSLSCTQAGNFDVYGNPVKFRAYSRYNGYQRDLSLDTSVIGFNNLTRRDIKPLLKMFAMRLYNLDRIIDVNSNAQKTPVLVRASESQRLTMLNLYKEYDGNQPFIFGDKDLDMHDFSVLSTDAPYISDKIFELKTNIWNEAMTYLGISNVSITKKERMVTDEVNRSLGGTLAGRYSRLEARKQMLERANKLFGWNASVKFRFDAETEEQTETSDGGELDE